MDALLQVVSGDFAQAKMSSAALGQGFKVHHTFTAEPMECLKTETFLSLLLPFQASMQNR